MTDLATPTNLLTPVPTAPTAASSATDARIKKTAQDFEASFLSQMLKPMFDALKTDGPFGGGEAEGTWRGFMVDAMAKKTVQAGGVGLTNSVMSEMLKMQEGRS